MLQTSKYRPSPDPTKPLQVYPFGSVIPEFSYKNVAENDTAGYRYGFNTQEKDDEVAGEGNSYTAEFWQYDSRLGRRWNVDPYSFILPFCSPFKAFFNNPIYWVDPKGSLEDDYGVNKDGTIILLKETDDNFDRLFSVDEHTSPNGPTGYIKRDLNNNDNSNDDYIKINDKTLLSKYKNTEVGAVDFSNSSNKDEIFRLFKFLADNTSVEWQVIKYKNSQGSIIFNLSTQHDPDYSPSAKNVGIKLDQITTRIHSHPNTPVGDEEYSMGKIIQWDGYKYITLSGGDWSIVRNNSNNGKAGYLYYVYFPGSTKLYNLRYQGPAFIRYVNNSFRRFYFGTF